jgi:Uri superfamily endonuclease
MQLIDLSQCKRERPSFATTDPSESLRGKGSYCLILFVSRPANLIVGKLGRFRFAGGYYAYVGSAFGPGGLAARLRHHLKKAKRPHWHIDYLRNKSRIVEIWHDGQKVEHLWAESLVRLPGAQKPVKGFGCSDCRCFTHLFYFAGKPSLIEFERLLGD